VVGRSGEGVVAIEGDGSITVLPVRWGRVSKEDAYEALLPRVVFELAAGGADRRAALTTDRSSAWRAAEMTGLMLQGRVEAFALGETSRGLRALRARLARRGGEDIDDPVLLRLRPDRLVWWQGWSSGTTTRRRVKRSIRPGRAGPRRRIGEGR
jgi:hypothetical protein